MASEDRFGFEWNKYSYLDANYELQFRRWVSPLKAEDFKGKSVLDAGCGMGRNSYWALKWGADSVTAFDYGRSSIEAAKKNLADFKNAEVFWKSIYEIEWQDKFDIAFSIGVIHHLKDPEAALKNLVKAVKPGGRVLIWVYSYEGNEWIVKFVNPVRKHITSKLPVGLTHFLSYIPSIPLWIFLKLFKGPSPYLKQLSGFSFKHVHSIVFDQLIPEVANYWRKEEVNELMENAGLKNVQVHRPENQMGWTALGEKI